MKGSSGQPRNMSATAGSLKAYGTREWSATGAEWKSRILKSEGREWGI